VPTSSHAGSVVHVEETFGGVGAVVVVVEEALGAVDVEGGAKGDVALGAHGDLRV